VAKLVAELVDHSAPLRVVRLPVPNLLLPPRLGSSFPARHAVAQTSGTRRATRPEEQIPDGRPGRKPIPTRRVLEAILWILNTGAQWHMLPQSFPNYKTVHRRFQTWCRGEILRRVLTDVANELRDRGAAAGPAVQRTQRLYAGRSALIFGQNAEGSRRREWMPRGIDLAAVVCKPCGGVVDESPLGGELGIALDNILAIVSNCGAEFIVTGEGRILLPASRPRPRSEKASTIASSNHWHGGFGLACGCQLLARTWPSSWPNWYASCYQARSPTSTIIQAMLLPSGCNQTAGGPDALPVRDKTDAVEAGVPHALDHQMGRAGEHVTPIAGEFDRGGKHGRSRHDWGRRS
jgi:transposase